MLKNKNCAKPIVTSYIQICMNKSLLMADNLERLFLGCIYKWQQNVTGFGKTDHIVTIDIARNTDLKC